MATAPSGSGSGAPTPLRRRLAGYAALVRVPNLFTAPPDVIAGAALTIAAGGNARPTAVGGAVVASTLLYAGGTTLNDYFDAEVDAAERPERPIPSGTVSHRGALALGLACLVAGVVVAAVAAGFAVGVVAVALALAVIAYDGALKGGTAGFLAMGAARGLNTALGIAAGDFGAPAAGEAGPLDLPAWLLAVPVVVFLYIAAVTRMAETETVGGDRGAVVVAAAGAVGAAIAVPIVTAAASASPTRLAVGTTVALALIAWDGRALRRAYADPVPETVGPAVGACVLGVIVLDAAFAAVAGAGWSAVALCFLLPAVGLSRLFDVS